MNYDKYSFPFVFQPPCVLFRFAQDDIQEANEAALKINTQNPEKDRLKKLTLQEQTVHPSVFNLSYPFISDLENNKVQSSINQSIIDEIDSMFKSKILLPVKNDFNEISGFYKVPLNEKGLISILFGLYLYTGGAHGITIYSSLNINSENGIKYNFTDLFNPKLNYIGVLNDIIIKEINEKEISLIRDFEGITEEQQFYFTQDALVLYYQLYDYTAYAHGLFEISIPYSDIINLLCPPSPIIRLI